MGFFKFSAAQDWLHSSDNRQAPRFMVRPVVTLELANGAVVQGRLIDMSVGGAFLETAHRPFGLEAGEEGSLGLSVPPDSPDSDYRFRCEVIRVTPLGVALRFREETENDVYGWDGSQRQMMPDDFME